MAKIDNLGREVLDPTPKEIPVGFHRPPTLEQQIMRLMRRDYLLKEMEGYESPEEADDFDVDDMSIDDLATPYENEFMPNLEGAEKIKEELAKEDAREQAKNSASRESSGEQPEAVREELIEQVKALNAKISELSA